MIEESLQRYVCHCQYPPLLPSALSLAGIWIHPRVLSPPVKRDSRTPLKCHSRLITRSRYCVRSISTQAVYRYLSVLSLNTYLLSAQISDPFRQLQIPQGIYTGHGPLDTLAFLPPLLRLLPRLCRHGPGDSSPMPLNRSRHKLLSNSGSHNVSHPTIATPLHERTKGDSQLQAEVNSRVSCLQEARKDTGYRSRRLRTRRKSLRQGPRYQVGPGESMGKIIVYAASFVK